MNYRNVMSIAAVIAILFGLGFILMPAQLVSFYGVELAPAGLLVAQLYGASLFGFGLLDWLARGLNDSGAQQAILTGNFAADAIGFIFALIGQLGGVPEVNALGWSTVLLYLLLGLAFGYLRFFNR